MRIRCAPMRFRADVMRLREAEQHAPFANGFPRPGAKWDGADEFCCCAASAWGSRERSVWDSWGGANAASCDRPLWCAICRQPMGASIRLRSRRTARLSENARVRMLARRRLLGVNEPGTIERTSLRSVARGREEGGNRMMLPALVSAIRCSIARSSVRGPGS